MPCNRNLSEELIQESVNRSKELDTLKDILIDNNEVKNKVALNPYNSEKYIR